MRFLGPGQNSVWQFMHWSTMWLKLKTVEVSAFSNCLMELMYASENASNTGPRTVGSVARAEWMASNFRKPESSFPCITNCRKLSDSSNISRIKSASSLDGAWRFGRFGPMGVLPSSPRSEEQEIKIERSKRTLILVSKPLLMVITMICLLCIDRPLILFRLAKTPIIPFESSVLATGTA